VRSHLPFNPTQRRRKLFALARTLKARGELVWAGIGELRPILQAWYHRLSPKCQEPDFDTVWAQFLKAWGKIKMPEGQGPLQEAWEAAGREPLPPEAELFGRADIRRLVGLCLQLQKRAGRGDFPLPCRTVGSLLGMPSKNASTWLGALEGAGILQRTFAGSAREGKANRYRYVPVAS
jgi:hypothetical protein